MTEEEFFISNYPDSCYGDKPLSPHWDFFQEGVAFGERQSEKKIEELEKENKTISRKANEAIADKLIITAKYNEVLNDLNQKNDELQRENAELKEQHYADCELVDKTSKTISQLTKAKEIIREYSKWECEYCDYKRNPDYVTMHCSQCQKYPLHKKAEQFLSEVDK